MTVDLIYREAGPKAVARAIAERRVIARTLPPVAENLEITSPRQLRKMLSSPDHVVMVKIPAGEAVIGLRDTPQPSIPPSSDYPRLAKPEDEKIPIKEVWMGMTPLSFGHYLNFLNRTQARKTTIAGLIRKILADRNDEIYRPEGKYGVFFEGLKQLPAEVFLRLPALDISFEQSLAIAQWLSGHIPSLEEWQKACRGTEGNLYCWGNSRRVPRAIDDFLKHKKWVNHLPGGISYTGPATIDRPVVLRTASPFGVLDMNGGVDEWVSLVERHQIQQLGPMTQQAAQFLAQDGNDGVASMFGELGSMALAREKAGTSEIVFQAVCGGIDWMSDWWPLGFHSSADYHLIRVDEKPLDLRNGVRFAWSPSEFEARSSLS